MMNVLSYAAAAGLAALIVYLMVVGNSILLPLVIATFICYLINALATASRNLRIFGRALPNGLRLAAAILIILSFSWFVVNLVITNINQVMEAMPGYQQNLQNLAARLGEHFGNEYVDRARALVTRLNLTSVARDLALSIAGILGRAGTVAIYVAFLLLEQHSFDKKIAALCRREGREALLRRILKRIGSEIQTYVWLKTLTSLIVGVGSYLVMKIVGVDYAEFWALLIFALNFIPYIGSLLGVVFPTVLALVQFPTLTPFFVMAVVLIIIQFTTGSIIEPKLMGRGLNLSPVIVVLSLSVLGTIWGLVGMFLAVPLMVVIMIVCSQFESTRRIAILMSADGELRN
jgi:predicted PurR-regulated permease PerM